MKIKRKIALLTTCILLFTMTALPVSAAEIPAAATVSDAVVLGTSGSNSFRGMTSKLNSAGSLASSTISSGSISADNRSVTSVTVYCRVASGSDSFRLVVTSPSGTTKYVSCGTSSATYTIPGFNGEDPKGTWKVGIISNGISTVTCTLTVNYDWSYN